MSSVDAPASHGQGCHDLPLEACSQIGSGKQTSFRHAECKEARFEGGCSLAARPDASSRGRRTKQAKRWGQETWRGPT